MAENEERSLAAKWKRVRLKRRRLSSPEVADPRAPAPYEGEEFMLLL